jgi:hypothetical protein
MGNIQADTSYDCPIIETELNGTWYKLNDRISWPTLKIPNDGQVYFVIHQKEHIFNGFWRYTCMSSPENGLYAMKQDPLDILDLGSFVQDITLIIGIRRFHMVQDYNKMPYGWSIRELTTDVDMNHWHTTSKTLPLGTIPGSLIAPPGLPQQALIVVTNQHRHVFNGVYRCHNDLLVPVITHKYRISKTEQESKAESRILHYILEFLVNNKDNQQGFRDVIQANPHILKYITLYK